MPPLTTQQVNFFHEEGYLIISDVFHSNELEPIRQSLHDEIGRRARDLKTEGKLADLHKETGFDRQLAAIMRDSRESGDALIRHLVGVRGGGYYSPEIFALITHSRLIDMIGMLIGSQEIIASAYRIRPKLPNFDRGVVPWHQDSGYLSGHCDEHLILTCWVPFVDATEVNGCMQILPRTHGGKIVPHYTGGNADFLVIKNEDLPGDPRLAITATCPRGGAVFMTNRTPHCSTPNISDHIRWSMDLRYKAADVPNNVGIEPKTLSAHGRADAAFYESVNVACYPPDADFIVRSERHPERVVDYLEYVRLRELYDHTLPSFAEVREWPPLNGQASK